MKRTNKLERFFKFFWLSSDNYDPVWDKLVNALIDKGEVIEVDTYTITFEEGYVVWIKNHPWCSGNSYHREGLKVLNMGVSKETKIKLEDFYYAYMDKKEDPLYAAMKEYTEKLNAR